MNILVTGATGFIGGRLVDRLTQAGHSVRSTGRRCSNIEFSSFLSGDLLDPKFCFQLCDKIEAVVHCAGMAGAWGPYADYKLANVDSTSNLLSAAHQQGVSKFIFISSPSIYFRFKNQLDLREDQLPPHFVDSYARTKYESEILVSRAHQPNFSTLSLRPRSVIGRGDNQVLPRLIALQESGRLVQIGDGTNQVDVTSVSNLLDAIELGLQAPPSAWGKTYNITNGVPVRFWEMADELFRLLGISSKRKKIPYSIAMPIAQVNQWVRQMIGQKSEPKILPLFVGILGQSMTLNIDQARRFLNYSPRQGTQSALEEFIAEWKARTLGKTND